MSSWLSISIPNPFKPSQSDEPKPSPENPTPSSEDHSVSSGGVKDDLSVIGQTIGRQLRGVAAFLAPLPSPPHSATAVSEASSSQTFLGIKNDLVEIGGSFKSGLSLLSTNKAVTEISRLASNLLQFDGDEDGEGSEVAGVSDEVLDFVEEISLRPECWTDFPSSVDNEFVMSDAQREHASTVEHFVPNLAALRNKLHGTLSDEQFWMIYYILLLPRLNEHDSKLLSTPEIVDAREVLLQKLKNKRNAPPMETSEEPKTVNSSQEGDKVNYTQEGNNPFQEKEILAGPVNIAQGTENDDHENAEPWLDNEGITTCTSEDSKKQPENEEDVSFSDLEDDDNDLSGFRRAHSYRVSSPSGSSEWVQLNNNSGVQGDRSKAGQSISREKDSEGEESNDWLTVDDHDLDSLVAV